MEEKKVETPPTVKENKYKIFFSFAKGSLRKTKRRVLSRHLNLVRVSLIFTVTFLVFGGLTAAKSVIKGTDFGNLLIGVKSFVIASEDDIESFNGKTNILLLGKSGEGSDSPELTDTIILVSIAHSKPYGITTISIPRDIWVDDLDEKINEAYKLGNEVENGGGFVLAKSSVEQIVGVPVHYTFIVDFAAFKSVIDTLDGVEINVERAFKDEKYPIKGRELNECSGDPEYKCRFETLVFSKGLQTMDGDLALKFARSRQSTDILEGTDFARSARQQIVIKAIVKKLLSLDTFFSPKKILQLWKMAKTHTTTDINISQAGIIFRRIAQSRGNVESHVIPENYLENPPLIAKYNYLYVFIPAESEDWSQLHEWVLSIF